MMHAPGGSLTVVHATRASSYASMQHFAQLLSTLEPLRAAELTAADLCHLMRLDGRHATMVVLKRAGVRTVGARSRIANQLTRHCGHGPAGTTGRAVAGRRPNTSSWCEAWTRTMPDLCARRLGS